MDLFGIFKQAIKRAIKGPKKPIETINLESARSCNLKCIQCAPHGKAIADKFDRSVTTGIMTLDTFSKILPILNFADHLNLDIHGEPLLNKDLEKIISLAKKSAPHLKVSMTSNFTLMNRERAMSLLKSGLNGIQVSVNGVKKETYEKIMAGANYERLLENLSAFSLTRKEVPNQLTSFSACITTMRSNIDELVMLPSFLSKYGIKVIRINSLLPYTPAVLHESMYDDPAWHSRREEIYKETTEEANRYDITVYAVLSRPGLESCQIPVRNLCVSYDGDVCPCFLLDIKGGFSFYYTKEPVDLPFISFGNVNEREILEIWKSDRYVAYRKAFKDGKLPEYCRMCPVGKGLICG